jgi:signal peptidase I
MSLDDPAGPEEPAGQTGVTAGSVSDDPLGLPAGHPGAGASAAGVHPAGTDSVPGSAADTSGGSPGASPAEAPEAAATPARKRISFWKELPFLVVIALVLALLIKTFLVQAFFIPSGSMENTLQIGDRILVNKLVYDFRQPHRGEIIVFQGPPDWNAEVQISEPSNPVVRFFRSIGQVIGVAPPSDRDFVKRVIGVPGDVVACCNSRHQITVNGVGLSEPYIDLADSDPSLAYVPFHVKVPPGHLWVMGDHRDNSADSRSHITDSSTGTIPISDVIGRAFVVVWPPSHWNVLSVPSTFSGRHLAGGPLSAGLPFGLGLVGALPLNRLRRRVHRRLARRLGGRLRWHSG